MNIYKPKTDLQVIFQQRKLELPKYDVYKHDTKYCCTITLFDGREIIGEYCNTHMEAQNYTAEKAITFCNSCEIIQSIAIDTKKSRIKSIKHLVPTEDNPMLNIERYSTVLLINTDVKELSNELFLLSQKYSIFIFVEIGDTTIYPSSIDVIRTPRNGIDEKCTAMQMYLGMLLSQEKFDQYLVCTTHHFGNNMVNMIESSNYGWKPKKAFVVPKIERLF